VRAVTQDNKTFESTTPFVRFIASEKNLEVTTMNLIETIRQRVRALDPDALVKTLGYRSVPKGRKTLEEFLQAPDIESWLSGSHYDLTHSSRSFLKALCRELDLGEACEREIAAYERKQEELQKMETPWIFIYTGFRRKSEPIFALAFLEPRRRIVFDKAWARGRRLEEILDELSRLIPEHYREHEGKLPIWGPIRSYVYHHTDGSQYIFDPDGTLREDQPLPEENRAELELKGKKFDPNLLN
jgi:hypothetical protein